MTFMYNLGIRIYYILVLIASLFNAKAKLWVSGRRGIWKKLDQELDPHKKYVWFHASSLGEFEQGRPLIEALKAKDKDLKVILTFFSPSGYEVRKNYTGADIICYLPLDTKQNAQKFIRLIQPQWTFFIKYEYWYNYLNEVKKSGGKLFLVSGIFRENQLFFKPYGKWYRNILSYFDHLFVQNETSADLLQKHEINNFTLAGDSRFDRVAQIAATSKSIDIAEEFSLGSTVIVCGSTWEPDETNLIQYLQDTAEKDLKLIIAPHEIHKSHIDQITDKIKLPYCLFSEASHADLSKARVLIIDNIGLLSSIYKYGQISYIGGGFGTGIHNTLEAAVYNIPVIFGPNYSKFQEATDLIKSGGGFSYSTKEELNKLLDNLLNDPAKISDAGKAAGEYVNKMKGATSIIEEFLEKY
jgi:3-deoxy-D-manno-octulosonic-acid transferase